MATADGIEEALFCRIVDGRYRAGEPLPTIEQLSVELGASRNTVSAALRRLLSHGYLHPGPAESLLVRELMRGADFRVLCRLIASPREVVGGLEVHGQLLELLAHTLTEVAQCAAVKRDVDHLYWLRWRLVQLQERSANAADAMALAGCHYQLWWVLSSASGNLAHTVFVNGARPYLSSVEVVDLLELPEWHALHAAIAQRDPFAAHRIVERGVRRKLNLVLASRAHFEQAWERETAALDDGELPYVRSY